jgi:ligand-binding sensor domain-containing protein
MTILKKGTIIILFSFSGLLQLCAQTPSYYHYTTTEGLASSTIFQIIQDKDGFIWFATLNGLSRFDGKRFTTFRKENGLNSNAIIALAEGDSGKLYIGNYEKGINVRRNGRIEDYFSESGGRQFPVSYILYDAMGNDQQKMYTYRSEDNIHVIKEKFPMNPESKVIISKPLVINKLEKLKNGDIFALTKTGISILKNDEFIKLNISGLPDTTLYCLTEGENGNYFVGSKGMIYNIKDNHVAKEFKIKSSGRNDVIAVKQDRKGNLWFSIMNKGFYFIQKGSEKILDMGSKLGLQNSLVNGFLEDSEGDIWLSTFGKGVYCLNNLFLNNYNENNGLSNNSIYSIVSEKSGKLFIGTFNGINILEDRKIYQAVNKSSKRITEYIYSIKDFDNEFYASCAIGRDEVQNTTYKGIKLNILDGPSFCKTHDGLCLFGSAGNIVRVQKDVSHPSKPGNFFFVFGDSAKINRVNTIFEDTKRNVWIGTGLGLCKATHFSDPSGVDEWNRKYFPDIQVLNSKINSIWQDKGILLWFATEKGVASYNLENDSVQSWTNINGYDLSSATSIVSDNKKRLWIGCMRGLYLYDGKTIRFLGSHTGLPSDEVLSLCYDTDKNLMYIGTSNGLSILDISLFDNYLTLPPQIKIIGVTAGDSIYTSYSNLVFRPDQHNVLINFKALNFSSPGSVIYKYKLSGEWILESSDFLNFISLAHGKYELQIMARAQNTDWGLPVSLNFRILPRFVETIWFKLLVICLFLLIAHFISKWRLGIHEKRNKLELELSEKINELKHKALSAMMNPHFISNSLNSVQYLVNTKQYEDANDYIAMMAKLMRKNLDTAGGGFILLSEEIVRLELYLDLEKLRFRENFSFEIQTGKNVDANGILIPNMIIQPFVENSLWHGIIDSGKPGLLTVSFTFEEVDNDSFIYKSLVIKITDNGIGIKEARKTRTEDHISKGIQIVEERLSLLSAKMQLPQPIMFEDLSSRNKDSHGTEVIISLPPQLYRMSTSDSTLPPTQTV